MFVLASALWLAGCATGPSPEVVKKQQELLRAQEEIKQGATKCTLPSDKITEIASLIKQADTVLKRKATTSSLTFDEASGIVSFSSERLKFRTPVTRIALCTTIGYRSSSSIVGGGTAITFSRSSFEGTATLYADEQQQYFLVENKRTGATTWANRVDCDGFETRAAYDEFAGYLSRIIAITGVKDPIPVQYEK